MLPILYTFLHDVGIISETTFFKLFKTLYIIYIYISYIPTNGNCLVGTGAIRKHYK